MAPIGSNLISGKYTANSHDDDKSMYLKHSQIIAVSDVVTFAPLNSAAQLRRNLQIADPDSPSKTIALELLRCVQRVVRLSRPN